MLQDQVPVPVRARAKTCNPRRTFHSTVQTGSVTLRLFIVYAPAGAEAKPCGD